MNNNHDENKPKVNKDRCHDKIRSDNNCDTKFLFKLIYVNIILLTLIKIQLNNMLPYKT